MVFIRFTKSFFLGLLLSNESFEGIYRLASSPAAVANSRCGHITILYKNLILVPGTVVTKWKITLAPFYKPLKSYKKKYGRFTDLLFPYFHHELCWVVNSNNDHQRSKQGRRIGLYEFGQQAVGEGGDYRGKK